MNTDQKPTVLSLEQALSMPYGTLRFVHLGWRESVRSQDNSTTIPAAAAGIVVELS